MEIDKDIPIISDLIEKNLIVKVVAPSASGKTTALPKALGKKFKVHVVVSHESIASSLNGLEFQGVKYWSSNEYSSRLLGSKKALEETDVLILDENDAFSTDIKNYIILSLWKTYGERVTPPKLVLTSNLPLDIFPEFPTYTCERLVPLKSEIRYLEDCETSEGSIEVLVPLIEKLHIEFLDSGAFLIIAEDSKTADRIYQMVKDLPNASVLPVYSKQNSEENPIGRVYQKTKGRKIIISDDIAKTSVSYKDVAVIFDSMKVRTIYPTITGGYKYRTGYISKRDAFLRSQRTGRDSITYRMCSEETYEELEPLPLEAFLKVPLHHLVIDIYNYGLSPYKILEGVPFEELDFTVSKCLEWGLIGPNLDVTPLGKEIRGWPLGLRSSIFLSQNRGYEAVVWVSILENYRMTVFDYSKDVPKEKGNVDYTLEIEEKIKDKFLRFKGRSDIETYMYLWTSFLEEKGFETDKQDMKKALKLWCIDNYISFEFMSDVLGTLQGLMKKLGINHHQTFIVEDFVEKVDGLVLKLYADRKGFLNLQNELITDYFNSQGDLMFLNPLSINTIEKERPLEIITLISSFPLYEDGDKGRESVDLSYVSPVVQKGEIVKEKIIVTAEDFQGTY